MKAVRRLLMLAALLAAVAVLVSIVIPFSWGATSRHHHARQLWGSNVGVWDKFHAAIAASKVVRVYVDSYGTGTVPANWPVTWPTVRHPGTCAVVSWRPMPGPLLAGKYDAYFRHVFATAPRCSRASIWHENANGQAGCTVGPCNPLGYPPALRDPARFRAMQRHMQALVKGTHVQFGVIGCGPTMSALQWYARGNGWYGTDLYFNTKAYLSGAPAAGLAGPFANANGTVSRAKVWARLDADERAFRIVSGQKYPLWLLGETNAAPDYRRIAWFTDLAQWFDTHNARRTPWIAAFFPRTAKGGLSTPWPPSPAVRAALAQIARTHQSKR